jgi:hypothetical protein
MAELNPSLRAAGHVLNSLCEMAECELTCQEGLEPALPISQDRANSANERLLRIEKRYTELHDRCCDVQKLNDEIGARLERYQDLHNDLALRLGRLSKVKSMSVISPLRAEAEELLRDVERDLERLSEGPVE